MKKSLIIVESPAKIKTLKQFLGPEFSFESSFGHIRDLPEKEFAVDIDHDFEPKYTLLAKKKPVVDRLKKAAKACDMVYLSPDPDREGEAIAWHISQILPPGTPIKRVAFNSITKEAVHEALKHPQDIDQSLVNAQQARRVLDRLVGYTISPFFNRRLKRGKGKFISAGRVQSVALLFVVNREKEIEAFRPQEYWTIAAELKSAAPRPFSATLYSIDKKKIEKEILSDKVEGKDYVRIPNESVSRDIVADLRKQSYCVQKVERKEKKRNPEAPFITSTLQQEASRHFRFSPSRTMQIAQTLYEGIDLGTSGPEGLITYMRTDSVRIAPEAIEAARHYIVSHFGKEFLSPQARQFHVKKSAQDAHEAIRPTSLQHTPETVQKYLTTEQHQLYSLIWKRFIASQMASAIYDTVSIDIVAGPRYLLRATGSVMKFPGFLAIYEEKRDEEADSEEEKDRLLPALSENDPLELIDLTSTQSFTRPPPRYTEATLIRELEKSGIGRPSTYATIMQKIQGRDYTVKEQGRLKPTELGRLLTEMLSANFGQIMTVDFTALLEDGLEAVAESKKDWKGLLRDFWHEFSPALEAAETQASIPKIVTEFTCPKCGGKLQKVWSKSKYFLGCEQYPECDFTSSLEEFTFDKSQYRADFNWDAVCPVCGSPTKLRFGKFGPFLGCQRYPECKGLINIPKKDEAPADTSASHPCPVTGCSGHLVRRRSRFGKIFYSCSEFPACSAIGNDIESVEANYAGTEKTPYQKKTRAKAGVKSEQEAAPPAKKRAKKAPAKKAPPKKSAPKRTKKSAMT